MHVLLMFGVLFSWYIRDFDVMGELSTKNKINISEVLTVDFQNERRHGIFRTIPSYFRGHPVKLKILSVHNLTNGSNTYAVKHGDRNINIRIGDKGILVSGIQKYQIDYSMQYVVFDTMDMQRLVLNITGNYWPCDIQHARFQMPFLKGIKPPQNIKCYTGPMGYKSTDCVCTTLQNSVVCETNRPLSPNEGMTVSMDFPKGTFAMPDQKQQLLWKYGFLWPILLPIIAFVIMYVRWRKYGRDPKTGSVVVSYEAPKNLTPIETGTLIDENVNPRDLTAEILNLAFMGYIKIEETPIKNEYVITKLKDCDENTTPFQCKILNGIFKYGDVEGLLKTLKKDENKPSYLKMIEQINRCNLDSACEIIALSSLKNKFYVVFEDVANDVYDELSKKGYFVENPEKVRDRYGTLGFLIAFLGFFLFIFMFKNSNPKLMILGVFSSGITGFIVAIFGRFLPRKTKKGAEALREIKGLLEFVHRTEKDRLKRFALQNPEMFKTLLPYAVALGEEKKWAEVFEEVYEVLQEKTTLNTVYITGGFATMMNTISTSTTTSPSSHGGGSGGGFSGGGAGGGGGGAW